MSAGLPQDGEYDHGGNKVEGGRQGAKVGVHKGVKHLRILRCAGRLEKDGCRLSEGFGRACDIAVGRVYVLMDVSR